MHSFFELGPELLEACVNTILRWPAPVRERRLELPLLGATLPFELPAGVLYNYNPAVLSPGVDPGSEELAGCLQRVSIYNTFQDLHALLWPLWELVLLGEPILILASSPSICAQGVLAAVSLIWPV